MKIFYLIISLIFCITTTTAQTIDYARDGFKPLESPIVPVITPKFRNEQLKKSNFSKLNKLERKVFNRCYENDSPKNRISRLEEQIFGTIQNGDLTNRYLVLQKAIPKYLTQTYTSDITPYSHTASNTWRNLTGPLGTFFGKNYMGVPTGISPQINMPTFNTLIPDFQRANFTNTGWDLHNQNFGTGSRVLILD